MRSKRFYKLAQSLFIALLPAVSFAAAEGNDTLNSGASSIQILFGTILSIMCLVCYIAGLVLAVKFSHALSGNNGGQNNVSKLGTLGGSITLFVVGSFSLYAAIIGDFFSSGNSVNIGNVGTFLQSFPY